MSISKLLTLAIVLSTTIPLLLIVGETKQYEHSLKAARIHSVHQWLEHHRDQEPLAQQILTECLQPLPLEQHYQCIDAIAGSQNIVTSLKKTDAAMRSFAWPLSSFNQLGSDLKN